MAGQFAVFGALNVGNSQLSWHWQKHRTAQAGQRGVFGAL